ncbi:GntR family transcriptional regulator [Pseudoclostridium thermosuccinogenes]|uniref:GntR family transcriptional regulator n=1 Tax=Clostridium thermosuccinogenes TaxID=84032 RepID=UPI002FDA8592
MNGNNGHLYEIIYNHVINEIKSGKYEKGDRLPTEKELTEKFNVSRITTKKALELLAEEGIVKRIRGKGSYITKDFKETTDKTNEGCVKSGSLIGFVLPDYSDGYATELFKGIEEEATKHDLYIVHRRTFGLQDLEEKVMDGLVNLGVKGIIIMPVHGENYNPKVLRLVLDGFPVVFVDRYLKGIPSPCVCTDNIASSKMAVDYLLKLGHRYISFVSPPSIDTSTIEERMEGFIKSHAENGVPVESSLHLMGIKSTIPGMNTEENIAKDIEKIMDHLKRNPQITCLFATEYNIALLCRKAVLTLGKKVPDDISIICFDEPRSYTGDYLFTHVRQKEREMGAIAVQLIQKQIENGDYNKKVFLESELIIGQTTKKIT